MNNSKKLLAVLSTAAISTIIASAVATPASAKMASVLLKDASGKIYEYNYSDLQDSFAGGTALYDDFKAVKDAGAQVISYYDDVQNGFVSRSTILDAWGDAGDDFNPQTATETLTMTPVEGTIFEKVENPDGTVSEQPKQQGVEVSSVSAINSTDVTVKLADGFDAAKAADVNSYAISVNGAAAVKPTAVTVTGNSAKLSIDLSKQEGSLTVNGSDASDFDFKKPEITSVQALDAKHIQIDFSEKLDSTGAENIANYSLYNYATGDLVDLESLGSSGAATPKLQVDGKTVLITFSGTISSPGFVVNGLTNGKYLLYVDQTGADKVQDIAGNAITAYSNAEFTGTTAPAEGNIQLIGAAYNKAAKTITITGSELINNAAGKIDPAKLALTDGTTTAPLKGATYTPGTGATSVTLDLSTIADADYAKVSALTGNISLVASDAAYEDLNGNAAKGNTVVATQTVLPVATAAEYNEETNVLKLTFDTPIDISKVVSFVGLTVNGQDISSGATLKTTANSNVVEIQLSDATAATVESRGSTPIRTNTVVETPVVIPADTFTKVGATTADPGKNLTTTIAKAAVVQDTVAPTVTANLKGVDTGAGILTLNASEPLDTTIVGANIKFYASDDLTTPLGSLDPSDVLTEVGTTNSYTVDLSGNNSDKATADALKEAIDDNKTIVATIDKGAIKDINLTDINAVDTTAPIAVSVAEASYGSPVSTISTVSPATSNLVDVTFKDTQDTPKDVQLDKTIAEDTATYQFVSIANPNVKVDATAKYVWDSTNSTGVLHVIPNSTLINGNYKLVLTGLKTNTGLAVEDATTPGIATIASVTITGDTNAPQLASNAITLKDVDNSGTLSAGDTLTVKFNEPIKLNTTAAADVFTASSNLLGSSTVALGEDPSVVIVKLASDSTLALGDNLAVNVTPNITDLAGNKVASSQTTDSIAKPAGVAAPTVKSEVYADANSDGVVNKGDTLTITFDQTVKADEGSDLTNDVTLTGASFSNAVLSGDTLTLTIDTPPTDTAIVGQTADIDSSTDIKNSWNDPAGTAGKSITSADTTAPTVTGISYKASTHALTFTFSEPVNTVKEIDADSLAVALVSKLTVGNGASLGTIGDGNVTAATLSSDKKSVTVTLKGDEVIDQYSTITIAPGVFGTTTDNIEDASGNVATRGQGTAYTVQVTQ